jgi:prepilin-type N-terminal cleavage/methylation domain-containing protein
MNFYPAAYHRQAGFSLVEMAIVLTIVALLMGGLLPTLSGQIEQGRRADTRKQLAEIQQAMIGFAIINGRLPCPATANIATNIAGAGTEVCTNINGVVPWATLGTSETDAWGRRFTYSATNSFITNFTLSTIGNLTVLNAAGGTNIASTIPAVIVSHGSNGYGAYTQQGKQLAISLDADEIKNSNAGPNFVSHDFTPTFDDIVVWISPNILFNRMVEAGRLP